jgi:hypothetical protein
MSRSKLSRFEYNGVGERGDLKLELVLFRYAPPRAMIALWAASLRARASFKTSSAMNMYRTAMRR